MTAIAVISWLAAGIAAIIWRISYLERDGGHELTAEDAAIYSVLGPISLAIVFIRNAAGSP